MGEAMAPEISQLQSQLSSQRLGLFGGLAQTAMPLFAQGAQLPYQYGMQAAGLLGSLGQPDMVAPDIAYHKSSWEQYGMPLLEALMSAGGTALGTAVGGGGG
ncbi:unnamed protein product [marine sediment metagenome]|uniref:Uncharacterized protein n=1 Tax=marine sediment metagenome TaxID=412755 RepID=X1DLM9_9ZZZZ